MATAVTTDEIYERYLRKAITEINRLSQEIGQAADGAPIALPTGHPLATIFLLKYGPQTQELQEGVAFHGRAGNALIKSLQRLRVDPLEVYGTNCVKFSGAALDTSAAWLQRELRIVQPRLVVVMGDDALDFLNGIGFPLSQPVEAPPRRASAVHADDRGARGARHRPVARRAGREDRLLERLQGGRAVVGSATALLGGPRRTLAAAASPSSSSSTTRPRQTCGTRARGPTSRGSRSSSFRPCSRSSGWCCRCATRRWAIWAGFGLRGSRGGPDAGERGRLRQLRPPRRGDVHRVLVPRLLRHAQLGRPRQLDHPVGRRLLGVARPDEVDRRAPRARLHRASRSRSRCRASTSAANLGMPDLFFFACSSPRPRASGYASAGRGSASSPRSAARSR